MIGENHWLPIGELLYRLASERVMFISVIASQESEIKRLRDHLYYREKIRPKSPPALPDFEDVPLPLQY